MMHWTRGETLGKGAFGFVSMAKTQQESHLPPLVAVKSAKLSESESLSKEKELLDKFQDCPSILRCFGDDVTTENNEKLYNILLEYASGGCLVDRIHRKGLTENIVSRYTKSILKALIHIHKLGYVHCDVKPHNVLIVGDDHHEDAKLADFGSCTNWRDDIGKSCDFRGTVIYAAPESISRQEYVPESDVWALGCTVLHMLTGKSPWLIDRKTMEAKDVLFKIGCSNDIPEIQRHKISKEAKDFLKLRIPEPGGEMTCFSIIPFSNWQIIRRPEIAITTTTCHRDCLTGFTHWCLIVSTSLKFTHVDLSLP